MAPALARRIVDERSKNMSNPEYLTDGLHRPLFFRRPIHPSHHHPRATAAAAAANALACVRDMPHDDDILPVFYFFIRPPHFEN